MQKRGKLNASVKISTIYVQECQGLLFYERRMEILRLILWAVITNFLENGE